MSDEKKFPQSVIEAAFRRLSDVNAAIKQTKRQLDGLLAEQSSIAEGLRELEDNDDADSE